MKKAPHCMPGFGLVPTTGLLREPTGFFAKQTKALRLRRSGLFPFYLIQASL
jgi:hypothetical protein